MHHKEGRNGPSCGINAYYSRSPLSVAWLDCLWPTSSFLSCDNCSLGDLAHHEACLVEVVRVFILDAILGFDVGYQAIPALQDRGILTEDSLIVLLAIELECELWLALNKRTGPV